MKKVLFFLLLISIAAMPVQAYQINIDFYQKTSAWKNRDTFEALLHKTISHYENSGSQALLHSLYKAQYGQQPHGVTILAAFEKFAFEFVEQNPNAIDAFIQALENHPKRDGLSVAKTIETLMCTLDHRASKFGLTISKEQIRILAVFKLSIFMFTILPDLDYNFFLEIAQYADQQLQ